MLENEVLNSKNLFFDAQVFLLGQVKEEEKHQLEAQTHIDTQTNDLYVQFRYKKILIKCPLLMTKFQNTSPY